VDEEVYHHFKAMDGANNEVFTVRGDGQVRFSSSLGDVVSTKLWIFDPTVSARSHVPLGS